MHKSNQQVVVMRKPDTAAINASNTVTFVKNHQPSSHGAGVSINAYEDEVTDFEDDRYYSVQGSDIMRRVKEDGGETNHDHLRGVIVADDDQETVRNYMINVQNGGGESTIAQNAVIVLQNKHLLEDDDQEDGDTHDLQQLIQTTTPTHQSQVPSHQLVSKLREQQQLKYKQIDLKNSNQDLSNAVVTIIQHPNQQNQQNHHINSNTNDEVDFHSCDDSVGVPQNKLLSRSVLDHHYNSQLSGSLLQRNGGVLIISSERSSIVGGQDSDSKRGNSSNLMGRGAVPEKIHGASVKLPSKNLLITNSCEAANMPINDSVHNSFGSSNNNTKDDEQPPSQIENQTKQEEKIKEQQQQLKKIKKNSRTDIYGNKIRRGGKKHKVVFADHKQLNKPLYEVHLVESYKKYNTDMSARGSNKNCCHIF